MSAAACTSASGGRYNARGGAGVADVCSGNIGGTSCVFSSLIMNDFAFSLSGRYSPRLVMWSTSMLSARSEGLKANFLYMACDAQVRYGSSSHDSTRATRAGQSG